MAEKKVPVVKSDTALGPKKLISPADISALIRDEGSDYDPEDDKTCTQRLNIYMGRWGHSVMTFTAGDCGISYAGAIAVINVFSLIIAMANMAIILTWQLLLFSAYAAIMWITGICLFLVGFVLLFVKRYGTRRFLLNLWTAGHVFFLLIIAYNGLDLYTQFTRPLDILRSISNASGASVANNFYGGQFTPETSRLIYDLMDYGMRLAGPMIYQSLQYPFSALWLMTWQPMLAAFCFAAFPGIIEVVCLRYALGIRNYFVRTVGTAHDGEAIVNKEWAPEAEYAVPGGARGSSSSSSRSSSSSVSSYSSYSSYSSSDEEKPQKKRPLLAARGRLASKSRWSGTRTTIAVTPASPHSQQLDSTPADLSTSYVKPL